MALTRKYLKEIGIEPEKIDLIIEQHAETVDGLKAERDEFKEKASDTEKLQAEIETLKQQATTDSEWKDKFEKEHSEFEAFKAAETEKATKANKEAAYKEVLKEAGVSEQFMDLIVKGTDLESIEFEDNKITNTDALKEQIKADYAQCIVQTESAGVSTTTPPPAADVEVDLDKLSMADYIKARSK